MEEETTQQQLISILERVDQRLEKLEQNRVTIMVSMLCAVVCLCGFVFALSYAINSREQLSDQIDSNELSICAQAKSAAAGYNKRLPDESREAFLLRLEGRRDVLIAAGKLDCETLSGNKPFDSIRGKALLELDRILFPGIRREKARQSAQATPGNNQTASVAPSPNAPSGGPTAPSDPSTPSVPSTPEQPGGGNTPDPPPSTPSTPDTPTNPPSTPQASNGLTVTVPGVGASVGTNGTCVNAVGIKLGTC